MTRRWIPRAAWTLLTLVLTLLIALMCWEPFLAEQPGPPPALHIYKADISRDEWGVPHVHGHTDPDVAFGVAWAHAEDDFSTLQDVLAMTRCRYGAIAGEEGAGTDYVCHLFAPRALVNQQYDALPADTRALLDAYAAGMNLYAARHGDQVKLARLFPVNGKDIATGFALRLPFFAGIDRVLKPLVEGGPPAIEYGLPLMGHKALPYEQGGGDEEGSPNLLTGPVLPTSEDGSNAFAIAPKRSDDGATRLVSNTHQPWRGGVAWYEIGVQSDSGWHFSGALFPGSPVPLLGHNENLGWTHTVNRPDLADVYKLVLSPDGKQYRLDGKWLPLERERVWLPVRFGPLTLPIPRMVARSAHGPVIENAKGAFAFRYGGHDTIAGVDEWYRMGKAKTFAEWESQLSRMQIASTNAVYADRAGNIAYFYNARLPERKPGFDWRGVLPGDRSDLIWHSTVSWSKIPKNVNPASGFLFNSNNTPFLSAGPGSEIDPRSFAPEEGIETDLTNRTRRAEKLLSAAKVISRAELERIKYDTAYEPVGAVKWMMDRIKALDLRSEPDLQKAQALLAGWDWKADGKNPADTLAVMVLKEATSAAYNHRAPKPPHDVLADAVAHLTKYFGRIDPPLGEAQRIRQGKSDYPMDGGGDTLRAATSYNLDPKDGRLLVKHGDSFLMFVEWPKNSPVRSQSIVPFGSATTRPGSRHYADQSPLFSAHKLKPVYFEAADVAKHAVHRIVVSNSAQ